MGNSSSLLTQYDLEDLQNHTNHLCEYLHLLLFVCLVVLFCFPLKDGEKSSLECQFFLFLQVFV